MPDGVTTIESEAFVYCSGAEYTNLTKVTIPATVTHIESYAFWGCTNLTVVCFEGNAPDVDPNIFNGADHVMVYYQPGTKGWDEKFGGRPTALWRQQIPTRSSP